MHFASPPRLLRPLPLAARLAGVASLGFSGSAMAQEQAMAQEVVAADAALPPIIAVVPAGADADARVAAYLDNARRFAGRRSAAECRADAAATGDIIVCGAVTDNALPVPEAFGPRLPRTDGAAVNPGLPCEFTPEGCYEGVNIPKLLGAGIGLLRQLFDPDRNLGEGTALPERYRGANR